MTRLLWLALGLGMVLVALTRAPLGDVHWDAPIYLYQAKRFAETSYLADIVRNAEAIAAQVAGAWPKDEGYSEAFWRSSRIGHIALLGATVDAIGNAAAALEVAHWLFVLAMPLGLFLWCRVVLLVGRQVEPDGIVATGLGLSALLFAVSDVYAYLSGNLVSEVMSFGLCGAAVWALLASIRTAGVAMAAVSGILAFVGYTVRVESVWAWLAFMIAYLPFVGPVEARASALRCFVVAGTAALLGYFAYASALYPLADPRHYLAFAASLTQRAPGGVHAANLIFVVGGMLWIGALLALRRGSMSPVVRFGLLWLLLAGLPSWALIAAGAAVQVRMLIGLVPPLILLSAAGWSFALRHTGALFLRIALGAALVLVLISRPAVYAWLVEQPGVWRIQRLGATMFVPRYERVDYAPDEMAAISVHVFGGNGRQAILIAAPSITQEYLNLIRFFGPAYPADARLALVGDPTNLGSCEAKRDVANESVRFCSGFEGEGELRRALVQYPVLHLRRVQDAPLPGGNVRIRTAGFVLEELETQLLSDPNL